MMVGRNEWRWWEEVVMVVIDSSRVRWKAPVVDNKMAIPVPGLLLASQNIGER